eukprot:CAMPEP_0114599572 /NCGR_PEP_ID=MMETSP0125-20121206/22088_1 /TAXON_ID=485358 ORGANISM="Aristerostoma sp., Strain ATCC 50986" /NCGR_SAMPLE_ID=MMETSP0125 /ASSEMBLY_ACC=CAM_ASM_000245 /LENGTH=105 /DNA_ID=CAMNT_0001806729 /DNA_START=416 /DNA_END=733 /DNA_ORIENTATION=+
MPKGMGEHDVIADDFKNKCPICKHYVKGERCGFSNCSYRVKGKKFVEGKQIEKVESDWHHVGDCYQLFDPDNTGMANWLHLVVICKPINDQDNQMFLKVHGFEIL